MRVATRAAALAPRRADWARADLRRDPVAGLMVGLVALPLALGFGVSSGLGASAGLVTAIVAGALAAVFGGSHLQVSGPTGAMTVVLVPIVAAHGADGVLVVGLLAGLILIGLGWAGTGRFIRYIPVSVVEGFTLGIAAIIALQQLPAALGVHADGEKVLVLAARSIGAWAGDPHWVPLGMTAVVVVAILAVGRLRPTLPGALLAVAAATAANALLGLGARLGRPHPQRTARAAPPDRPARRPRRAGPAGGRGRRTRRPREPALRHRRGRDERRPAARPRPGAGRPGPGQPRLTPLRRHPGDRCDRADRGQRALGCHLTARRA